MLDRDTQTGAVCKIKNIRAHARKHAPRKYQHQVLPGVRFRSLLCMLEIDTYYLTYGISTLQYIDAP